MSEQYPPQPPPYYPPQPPPAKGPGIGTGFKMVLGGCLALAVIGIGGCVACGIFVGGLQGISNRNASSVNTPTPKENTITLEKFNQIKDGMTPGEVDKILGSYGKMSSSYGSGKYKTETYTWDGGFMKSVTGTFQDGKLTGKFQIGLD